MFLHLLSTQDHAAAATAKAGTSIVFVWKGETLPESWWCTEQMMTVPGADGCDQLVDYGGVGTLLMHKAKELEKSTPRRVQVYPPAAEGDNYRCAQVERDGRQRQALVLCNQFQ